MTAITPSRIANVSAFAVRSPEAGLQRAAWRRPPLRLCRRSPIHALGCSAQGSGGVGKRLRRVADTWRDRRPSNSRRCCRVSRSHGVRPVGARRRSARAAPVPQPPRRRSPHRQNVSAHDTVTDDGVADERVHGGVKRGLQHIANEAHHVVIAATPAAARSRA